MSAKQLALPDFTLKKKLILIIMFLVLLQNIVLLIFANYQFSQKELKSSIEHIQNECHLLHNDMKTQYHNVILCSNELISTINQTVKETIGVGVNEKAALSSDKNCPFVYINFDFTLVNKVASL